MTILATFFVPLSTVGVRTIPLYFKVSLTNRPFAVQTFFGMNTTEINNSPWPTWYYAAAAIPITVISVVLPLTFIPLLDMVLRFKSLTWGIGRTLKWTALLSHFAAIVVHWIYRPGWKSTYDTIEVLYVVYVTAVPTLGFVIALNVGDHKTFKRFEASRRVRGERTGYIGYKCRLLYDRYRLWPYFSFVAFFAFYVLFFIYTLQNMEIFALIPHSTYFIILICLWVWRKISWR